MDKALLEKTLLSAINENIGEGGWTELKFVGTSLINRGVNYKEMGYEKLFSLEVRPERFLS